MCVLLYKLEDAFIFIIIECLKEMRRIKIDSIHLFCIKNALLDI
jgi:hypothetical protein